MKTIESVRAWWRQEGAMARWMKEQESEDGADERLTNGEAVMAAAGALALLLLTGLLEGLL